MDKEEVLKVAQSKKALVGEMEKNKINKGNWISLIVAVVIAVIFMIVEGALGRYTSIYVLGVVCFSWASVFYFCSYFIAKRPRAVLIGAILDGLGAIIMLAFYILYNIGVL